MDAPLLLRNARPDDGPRLVPLMLLAGGGTLEFLAGPAHAATLPQRLAALVAGRCGPYSHRSFAVAEAGGTIVGMTSATPAPHPYPPDPEGVPADRAEHLRPLRRVWDAGSLYLSSLAVDPGHRRRGIGARLLEAVCDSARATGFDRVTVHVWADNDDARRLYGAHGFEPIGHAAIPWHPLLPHRGGSLLLRRFIRNAAGSSG